LLPAAVAAGIRIITMAVAAVAVLGVLLHLAQLFQAAPIQLPSALAAPEE
jgi:hypothetical protein